MQALTIGDVYQANLAEAEVDGAMPNGLAPMLQRNWQKNALFGQSTFPDGIEVGFVPPVAQSPDQARDATWQTMGGNADPKPFWLGFETLWNAPQFRKGPGRHQMGLYTLPLDQLVIIMDVDLPAELYAAFFPNIPVDRVKAHANIKGAWERTCMNGGRPPVAVIDNVGVAGAHNVGRNAPQQLQLSPFAVLPYNFDDNTESSNAIGTKAARKLVSTWNMWSTASRSSVVQVAQVDPADTNLRPSNGSAPWAFGYKKVDVDYQRTTPFVETNVFNISTLGASHFSVKTGIEMVGKIFQGGAAHKDVLEWNNVLAMLRSYYIRDVDKMVGSDPALVILTELLTVTDKSGDGFQVRDLRPLVPRIGRGCWYLPALSVPYFGLEVVRRFKAQGGAVTVDMIKDQVSPGFFNSFSPHLAKQFSQPAAPSADDQKAFEYYWGRNYAIQLGIVKAKLLLRYALQWMMPNPQNMVIELDATYKCTNTMILRDVGDWDIHSDAAVAIWGIFPGKARTEWENYNNDWLKIEYSPKVKREMHDAVPNDIYREFPNKSLGTQLGWAGYSTFKVWGSDRWDLDTAGTGMTDACSLRWGALHNEAYCFYLEQNIGIDLSAVRQLNLSQLAQNLAGAKPPLFEQIKKPEVEELSKLLHDTITIPENLRKIKAHHKNLSQPQQISKEEQRLARHTVRK